MAADPRNTVLVFTCVVTEQVIAGVVFLQYDLDQFSNILMNCRCFGFQRGMVFSRKVKCYTFKDVCAKVL